jgi:hypothetical protein
MVIARFRPAHRVELELEAIIGLPDANDESVDELDTILSTLVAGFPAELGGRDPWVAGEAVHATRLPVARVAGIDDHDAMEVATEPERGCQPCGTAADYCDVIGFAHDRSEGTTSAKTSER